MNDFHSSRRSALRGALAAIGAATVLKPRDLLAEASLVRGDRRGAVVVDRSADWSASQVKIGAGGWVMGVHSSDDGETLVCYGDVFGAFIWNGLTWDCLTTGDRLPAGTGTFKNGPIAALVAPSNKDVIYIAAGGYVFKSVDRGVSFTLTSFPFSYMNGNETPTRNYGPKAAVDPINPEVVLVGLQSNGKPSLYGGAYLTTDGGATWTALHSLTSPLPKATLLAISGVLFDRSSASGGRCQTIIAFSDGNGLYRSTDGGASWSLVATGPMISRVTDVQQSIVDNRIYICASPRGKIYRLDRTALVDLNVAAGRSAWSCAPHPTVADRLIAVSDGGNVTLSQDGGSSWSKWTNQSASVRNAPRVPWHATGATQEQYMSTARAIIDPVDGKIVLAEGIGVWRSTSPPPTSGSMEPMSWDSMAQGIELLVANQIIGTPRGEFLLACWDRPVFRRRLAEFETYPSTHGAAEWQTTSIIHGWSFDYASSNPEFIAALAENGYDSRSGYSLDGGQTWAKFATLPPWLSAPRSRNDRMGGGCIAAATDQNMVWCPSNSSSILAGINRTPYHTKDRGATWQQVMLPGVPATSGSNGTTGYSGLHSAYYLKRQIIAADRENIGRFLLFLYSTEAAYRGFYLTDDGGSHWHRVHNQHLNDGSVDSWNARLKSVPGKGGHYWYTAGEISGGLDGGLFRSTDQGANWTAIQNVYEVRDFAFGSHAPGKTYPRLWIAGHVNPSRTGSGSEDMTTFGIYYTDNAQDDDPHWTKVASRPLNWMDNLVALGASPRPQSLDVVVVGYSGSGFISVKPKGV